MCERIFFFTLTSSSFKMFFFCATLCCSSNTNAWKDEDDSGQRHCMGVRLKFTAYQRALPRFFFQCYSKTLKSHGTSESHLIWGHVLNGDNLLQFLHEKRLIFKTGSFAIFITSGKGERSRCRSAMHFAFDNFMAVILNETEQPLPVLRGRERWFYT